jgi:predicted ATP-grasp superfamily ATP-dependent carboligase
MSAGRTAAVLAALTVTLLIDLALTAYAVVRRPQPPVAQAGVPRQTILISGGKMTKALHLARAFHLAGHRVVLTESAKYRWSAHRLSRAVDTFYSTPEATDPEYPKALADIILRERVDVFVPVSSPASSVPEAAVRDLVGDACAVLHGDITTISALDDKAEFARLAEAIGLRVPHTVRVTDPRQVEDFAFPDGRTYILKRLSYNPVGRTDLTPLRRETPQRNAALARAAQITADDPWILQEFIAGREYCTHSTVRNGVITVFGCCESSAVQLNYAHVDKPEIRSWVQCFVHALQLSGQVSFDFIEDAGGQVYAIECNPRTHSAITMFHDHAALARAYLTDGYPEITPRPSARPTYWIYHELWRLLRGPHRWRRLQVILRGTDAVFAFWDPLPYLALHHLQIPALLVDNLRRRRGWTRIDFNIGKLVESGGD